MHGYLPFDADGTPARTVPHLAQYQYGACRRRTDRDARLQLPAPLVGLAPLPGGPRQGAPRRASRLHHDARRFRALARHRPQGARRRRRVGHVSRSIRPPTDYDAPMLKRFGETGRRATDRVSTPPRCCPKVLVAGEDAGTLTADGARLLDPTGTLQPGAPVCPPEGDAGTGMVATNAVAPAHRQHQRGHVDLRDGGAREAADVGA